MGTSSDYEGTKSGALHIEQTSASSISHGQSPQHLEDLDSIEQTQSGTYAWLVALTAGVGGLLFGKRSLHLG